VVAATFDGRPISRGEIHGMLTVLIFGGFGTVAAMLSFVTWFLARHPQHRRQLVANPALVPRAVDELMRRHGLVNNTRIATHAQVFRGVELRMHDQIQVPTALFGLDEAKFEHPMDVSFDRPSCAHAAFGAGPHRCPGALLARAETRIFLEEWLRRIPEFSVAAGKAPRCSPGIVNSMECLPLTWPVS
jgi:cytochrome P450